MIKKRGILKSYCHIQIAQLEGEHMQATAEIASLNNQLSQMAITNSADSKAESRASAKSRAQSRQIIVAARGVAPSFALLTLSDDLLIKIFSYIQTTTLCIGRTPFDSSMISLLRTCSHFTPYRKAFQMVSQYPVRPSIWGALQYRIQTFLSERIAVLDFRHVFVTERTNADWAIPYSFQVRKIYLPSLSHIDEAVEKKLETVTTLTSLDLTHADTTDLSRLRNLASIQELTFKIFFPDKSHYCILDPSTGALQKMDATTMKRTWLQGRPAPLFSLNGENFRILSQMQNLRSCHFECVDGMEEVDGYRDFLTQLARLSTLTELSLTGFYSMKQLSQIQLLAPLTHLRKLALSPFDPMQYINGDPFSERFPLESQESIAFVRAITLQFQQIEELKLSQFAFSDASITSLLQLQKLRSLILELDPSTTKQGIQQMSKLTSLRELHLLPRSIEQLRDVLAAIQHLPSFEKLELNYLGLSSNKVLQLVQKFKNEHFLCKVLIQDYAQRYSSQYKEIVEETTIKLKTQSGSTACIVM